MRNQGGEATVFGGDLSIANFDGRLRSEIKLEIFTIETFTCFHCNAVEHVPARADVNYVGFCRNCMKPICHVCAGKPCMPYEKKLELIESQAETDRHYEKLLVRGETI